MNIAFFLTITVSAAVGIWYVTLISPALKRTRKDWNHPNFVDSLMQLDLGTSISPEELNLSEHEIQEALSFMTHKLGIKKVRIGIRWNRTEKSDRSLTLEYYRPWIDALIEHGCEIILNVGPIKTFRWPEEHIPAHIASKHNLPGRYRTLYPDLSIAKESLRYLHQLLEILKGNYGDSFHTIQPENEAFNRFGTFAWRQDDDYLHKVIHSIERSFPLSQILLNTPLQPWGISAMTRFVRNSQTRKKLQLGLNYYYKNPYLDNFFTKILFPEGFDAITASELLFCRPVSLKQLGIPVMISELQMETWGKSTSPGNSEKELRFALTRVKPYLQNSKTILLWGFEHLFNHVKNDTLQPEHEKMISTISRINST